MNYFTDRISSGPVEGLNNKIKVIKRREFGFRNITNFAKRLFLDINSDLGKNSVFKHDFLDTHLFLIGDWPTSICSIFPIGI